MNIVGSLRGGLNVESVGVNHGEVAAGVARNAARCLKPAVLVQRVNEALSKEVELRSVKGSEVLVAVAVHVNVSAGIEHGVVGAEVVVVVAAAILGGAGEEAGAAAHFRALDKLRAATAGSVVAVNQGEALIIAVFDNKANIDSINALAVCVCAEDCRGLDLNAPFVRAGGGRGDGNGACNEHRHRCCGQSL